MTLLFPFFTTFGLLFITISTQEIHPPTIWDTGVTLSPLNNTQTVATFSCGANRFQPQIGHLFNSTQCRNLRDPMDVCCVAHDTCYSNQYGKEMCDNTFCNCLSVATEHNLCAIDAAGFCAAARLFGQMVYDMAGGVVNTSPVVN